MFERILFAFIALLVGFPLRKKKHRRNSNFKTKLISRSFSRNSRSGFDTTKQGKVAINAWLRQ